MSRIVRALLMVCAAGVVLSWSFDLVAETAGSQTVAGSQQDGDKNESEEKVSQKLVLKTDHIDKAGEKVGHGIDIFSQKISGIFGDWVTMKVFAGITWIKLLFCLALVFLVVLSERCLSWIIAKKRDSAPSLPDTIPWQRIFYKAILKPLRLFIWVYGLYFAISPLYGHFQMPDNTNLLQTVAKNISNMGGTFAIFWFVFEMVVLLDARLIKWAAATENTIDDMLAPLVGKTLRVFIVIIGGIIILQNLTGLQIGPLIASLGIGGLAVALAAKDSIANFFGTLTILFDKPFKAKDRVTIDKYDGNVEKVGFRSTKIRLLSGHLVTIPNEKIVNSSVENVAERPFIKWVTNIGITYDTPPEKVEQAVAILREILDNHEGIQTDFPPRVFFNGFNDYSLNIMVIAWYHPPNYWDYQAWLQRICLQILQRFNAEGIDFAFPTQTLHLASDDKRGLQMQILNDMQKGQ